MNKCQCIINEKGRSCRNNAEREMQVFQNEGHIKVGTGYFWIRVCEKHFWMSKPTYQIKRTWRWLK